MNDEAHERRPDLMGGPEPGTGDVMGGPEPDEEDADLMGGRSRPTNEMGSRGRSA